MYLFHLKLWFLFYFINIFYVELFLQMMLEEGNILSGVFPPRGSFAESLYLGGF